MEDLTELLLRWQKEAGYQLLRVGDTLILTSKAGTQRKVVAAFVAAFSLLLREDSTEGLVPIWTCVDIEQGKKVDYGSLDLNDPKIMDRVQHGTYQR